MNNMKQNELFDTDPRPAQIIQEANQLLLEAEDFRKRIEAILTREELETIGNILAKISLKELAEHGMKPVTFLNYVTK